MAFAKSKALLGSINGIERSRVQDLCNPEPDKALAPHWRVLGHTNIDIAFASVCMISLLIRVKIGFHVFACFCPSSQGSTTRHHRNQRCAHAVVGGYEHHGQPASVGGGPLSFKEFGVTKIHQV